MRMSWVRFFFILTTSIKKVIIYERGVSPPRLIHQFADYINEKIER